MHDYIIKEKIGRFVKEIFVSEVRATSQEIECDVKVNNELWLMNDHFPGTSIIQCFFQCAMLLYYEHNQRFDPEKNLFFMGDLKIKYRKPIFINDVIQFKLKNVCFMGGVLLYEGECHTRDGCKCSSISGSLSSKPRSIIPKK